MNSNKTHIVLLTDCLADLAGGAEKQIYELAKRLDKNKYQVTVVSLECCGQAPRPLIESTGSSLEIFRVVRVYGLSGLIQGIKFQKFLKREKVKILLTYHFSSDMWGTFWGHLAGVPVIVSNRRDMGFWRKFWHVAAYRALNPWVNKIVVVAEAVKDMVMKTEGVEAAKIEVVYNGIDLQATSHRSQATSLREGLKIKNDDLVIIHVANLKPVKGHSFLLKAFARISSQFQNAKLVLIGKDELNGQLQYLAENLGLKDRVLFLGKRDDVPRLLPLADICVLPSLSEGMSNAILEYMAAGKPVIATKVGGNPEIMIDGLNGYLVAPENIDELKNALRGLLENETKRKEMGQNSLKRVKEHFSMEAMVARYENLFSAFYSPKSLRLLHLVSSGGLYGAERVILNLAGYNGHLSFVGALNNHHNPHLEIIKEAKKMGLETAIFESQGRFDMGTVFRVKNFLKMNNIDIIHTHNYKSDIVGSLAARLAGKRWVATNHNWLNTSRRLRLYEHLDAFVLKFADKVVAVSDDIKAGMVKRGFRPGQVNVIHNGIDTDLFADRVLKKDLRRELGINNDDIVVSIVGRLAKEKGIEIFLDAAKIVLNSKKDVRFLIVGDGPLNGDLKSRAQELDLGDRVIFTGNREDMPQIYSITDILVNSSYIEGLPMTILEAMAAKVPIIATKVGAVPKVILNEHNGILLEPGNAESLAKEICDLIERPDKRKSLAEAAYRDVREKWGVGVMAANYREVYKEVLEKTVSICRPQASGN